MGASVLRYRAAAAQLVSGLLRQRLHALPARQRSEYDVNAGRNYHGLFAAQLRRIGIWWRRRSRRRFRRRRWRRLLELAIFRLARSFKFLASFLGPFLGYPSSRET